MPESIQQPEYAVTSVPTRSEQPMVQSTPEEVARMRSACQLAKAVLDRGGKLCKVCPILSESKTNGGHGISTNLFISLDSSLSARRPQLAGPWYMVCYYVWHALF